MSAIVREMPRREEDVISALAAPELERIVLYSALTVERGYDVASRILEPADFILEAHKIIWSTASTLSSESESPNLHNVLARLHEEKRLPNIGGISYLVDIGAGSPRFECAERIEPYARRVKRLAIARLSYQEAEYVRLAAESGETEIAERLSEASRRVKEASLALEMPSAGRGPAEAIERAGGYQALISAPSRVVPVEFSWLRRLLPGGGLRPGQLWTLAARPGVGKSALALQMAVYAALQRRRTMFFSLEMSEGELMQRIFALLTQTPLGLIQGGMVTDPDNRAIMAALSDLDSTDRFFIADDVRTLNAIISRMADCHRRGIGYDFVVVDYIGLVTPPRRSDMRTNEISQITRALKVAAMDYQCSVLALSQMNRAIEQDLKREPQLSDLRESGSIEQDSDGVMFLWPDRTDEAMANLGVKKQRNGPTGKQRLRFLKQFVRFVEEAENGRDYDHEY